MVLGGGGVKGMAHLGSWRYLREIGQPVAGLIGCSIGAVVAASIAGGSDVMELYRTARTFTRTDIVRIQRRAAWVNGIKTVSVFRGDVLRGYIERILPTSRWEDLEIPLLINAVDLGTGAVAWFGHGARTDVSLVDAIYASAALPVFYPPALLDGRYYVDGGIHQALPVDRAADVGASGVLAVDAGSSGDRDAAVVVEQGMIAIHQRAMSIMIAQRRHALLESWSALPIVVVRPDLDGYGTFDFDHVDYFLEEGYRATRDALAGEERK